MTQFLNQNQGESFFPACHGRPDSHSAGKCGLCHRQASCDAIYAPRVLERIEREGYLAPVVPEDLRACELLFRKKKVTRGNTYRPGSSNARKTYFRKG